MKAFITSGGHSRQVEMLYWHRHSSQPEECLVCREPDMPLSIIALYNYTGLPA